MKIAIWVVLIIIALIIFLNMGEDNETLGDNYYYLPQYEAMDVGFPEGAVIYKSSQKYVFSDIKIHGEVASVNHNKDFILAIQQQMNSSNVEKVNSEQGDNKILQYFIIEKNQKLFMVHSRRKNIYRSEKN